MKSTFLKNYGFSLVILASMLIGAIAGGIFGEKSKVVQPVANIFMNLLFCAVVPLIFVSLVSAIASMPTARRLAKILGWMLPLFLVSSVIAAIYMLVVLRLFDPGRVELIGGGSAIDISNANSNVLDMLTVKDFPLLFSRSNLTALVVFTIMFGVALSMVKDKAKPVVEFFAALTEVILKIVTFIIYLAPIGLGCLFATLIGEHGPAIAGPMGRAIIIFIVAAIVYYVVSNTAFAALGAGRLGVRTYWKFIAPPSLTSLGTSSSAATIPVNLIACKRIGLSDEITDITVPLGANLHKDGAVLIQIMKIGLIGPMFGINMFEPGNMITAITISVIAATVMGAIPAGGYAGEVMLMAAFGFPVEALPIMVLLGTVTDAPATTINCTGDVSIAMVLARIVDGKNWLRNRISGEVDSSAATPEKIPAA